MNRPTQTRIRIDGDLYVVERWEKHGREWVGLAVRYEQRNDAAAEVRFVRWRGER